MPKEILTYQIGNYSNHVGTHFWNLVQDEVIQDSDFDKNVLFRNCSSSKQLWKPRVIAVDLKMGVGNLSELGYVPNNYAVERAKENVVEGDMFRDSTVEVYEQPPTVSCANEVESWSEHMKFDLHQNSLQLIDGYEYSSSDYQFSYHNLGKDVCRTSVLRDDLDDKLHFWIEECDSLDGFQFLSDIHDGFSGITSSLLADVHDEFPRKSKLVFANWPVSTLATKLAYHTEASMLAVNTALSLVDMAEYCNLFTLQSTVSNPFDNKKQNIQVPGVDLTLDSTPESALLLARAVDCISFPWRSNMDRHYLSDFCLNVGLGRWKMAGIGYGNFPSIPVEAGCSLLERVSTSGAYFDGIVRNLLPHTPPLLTSPYSLFVTVKNSTLDSIKPKVVHQELLSKYRLNHDLFTGSMHSIIQALTHQLYPPSSTVSLCSCKPELSHDQNSQKDSVAFSAGMCCMYISAVSINLVSRVLEHLNNMDFNKMHVLKEFGLEKDGFLEMKNNLMQFRSSMSMNGEDEEMIT